MEPQREKDAAKLSCRLVRLNYGAAPGPTERRQCWNTIVFAVIGIVGGYFGSVGIGLLLSDDNLAPLPFLFLLWPIIIVVLTMWGSRLDDRYDI